MLKYLIIYYLIGCLVQCFRLGRQWWISRSSKSPFDEFRAVVEIPVGLVMAWLWPLIVVVDIKAGLSELKQKPSTPQRKEAELRWKDRDDFFRQMPRCSSVVRVDVSHFPDNLKSVGVFEFDSDAMYAEISNRVAANPHLRDDDEGHLLSWLATRQSSDLVPCESPVGFSRLEFCVDVLAREGHGQVLCRTCGDTYKVQTLISRDDVGAKYNYNELLCPQGHQLLKRLRIRFF